MRTEYEEVFLPILRKEQQVLGKEAINKTKELCK